MRESGGEAATLTSCSETVSVPEQSATAAFLVYAEAIVVEVYSVAALVLVFSIPPGFKRARDLRGNGVVRDHSREGLVGGRHGATVLQVHVVRESLRPP